MSWKDIKSKKQDYFLLIHPNTTNLECNSLTRRGDPSGKLILDDISYQLETNKGRVIIIDDEEYPSNIAHKLPPRRLVNNLLLGGALRKRCVTIAAMNAIKNGYGDVLIPDKDCIVGDGNPTRFDIEVSRFCEKYPNSRHIFKELGFDE